MSIFNDVMALVTSATVASGYAETGQKPPYVVARPFLTDPDERNLDGSAVSWDAQFAFYCVGASVEASYNLAIMVMKDVDGKRVGGTTIAASMSYVGAQVEGRYESMVLAQLNQGGI